MLKNVMLTIVTALFLMSCTRPAVVSEYHYTTVDSTVNLCVFYPDYNKIDLWVDSVHPNNIPSDVIYAAPAAFTGKRNDVCGSYKSYGSFVKRMSGKRYSGCFVYGNDGFDFYYNKQWKDKVYCFYDELKSDNVSCGFVQEMLIFEGKEVPHTRPNDNRHKFRALCKDANGRLCVIESKSVVTLGWFIKCLLAYKVQCALYMDMGGWDYACWYDANGDRYSEGHIHNKYSNFLIFTH